MNNLENQSCWVMTEGMIGTQNQCVAVAEALGATPEIKTIKLNQPWKTLTPWLGFEMACTFKSPLKTKEQSWPDIVIAAGRKSIAASHYIKRKSKGKTFVVQLQDPKVNSKTFDLVAVPFHDSLRGSNVIVTDAAPNRLTTQILAKAYTDFTKQFKKLSSPRIAVLIGGNSRTHTLDEEIMEKLINDLKSLKGSLMVTASRRTGGDNLRLLNKELKGKNIYNWDGTGENPYFGMLAWADHILVTADSVSMISDAGTTGKPVHMIPLKGGSERFDRFHQHMQDRGVMLPFAPKHDGTLNSWRYQPLNDAHMIAEVIRLKMEERHTEPSQ